MAVFGCYLSVSRIKRGLVQAWERGRHDHTRADLNLYPVDRYLATDRVGHQRCSNEIWKMERARARAVQVKEWSGLLAG
jgi:hypothetical protein